MTNELTEQNIEQKSKKIIVNNYQKNSKEKTTNHTINDTVIERRVNEYFPKFLMKEIIGSTSIRLPKL